MPCWSRCRSYPSLQVRPRQTDVTWSSIRCSKMRTWISGVRVMNVGGGGVAVAMSMYCTKKVLICRRTKGGGYH